MSRIGKAPVAIPAGVHVSVQDGRVDVKGPKGELALALPRGITARVDGARVELGRAGETKQDRANHGTARSLLANCVEGVTQGYHKDLEIQGVGFRAALQGKKLVLSLGFSHPVEFMVPDGVQVKVTDNTLISVSGADKQQVGEVSARIRSYYPPEPYKGKGVRYKGEYVRRKVGKTVS